ncbi:MAG: hypothetical protein LBW85_07905 [Deltaproteobacteria bacterium]|nr:hypothetical protein [Deltaproteobacteria bacterium]
MSSRDAPSTGSLAFRAAGAYNPCEGARQTLAHSPMRLERSAPLRLP